MENKKPKVGKLPTIKQTHILNFIFFIIIALLWIPYGFAFFIKQADARTYQAILLIPLPIIGLYQEKLAFWLQTISSIKLKDLISILRL